MWLSTDGDKINAEVANKVTGWDSELSLAKTMNIFLKSIRLKNYRGFSDHTVPFTDLTVAVGRNNAGKSTIVEALKLVSVITSRIGGLNFFSPPDWTDLRLYDRGVYPSLKNLDFNFDTIFHEYGNPPAIVEALFTTGHCLRIYVNKESIFATVIDQEGNTVKSKSAVSHLQLPNVAVLPQVGPLAKEESPLTSEYVKRYSDSSLSSSHFRNQIWHNPTQLPQFQETVEKTWPGVRVRNIEIGQNDKGSPVLRLWVQDGDFTAESSWMGHGLQMWLQTIWLLVRYSSSNCVVLDEPDVYMHPDLQRRLIRFLRNRNMQLIVATHSTEILAEVNPEQILVIDRKKSRSEFATYLPAVQSILDGVGSTHNINLTRLWSARRLIIVEGEDIKYLKHVHDMLFPNSKISLDALPKFVVNGWGGWSQAITSASFLKNSAGEGIVTYCIFDSDFHTQEEIRERYEGAVEHGIQLHIWQRKEIENYFVCASVIHRIISRDIRKGSCPDVAIIANKINEIALSMRDDVLDGIASEVSKQNRKLDTGTANKKAREVLEKRWVTEESRLSVVPGKRLLSTLSAWAKAEYGVLLSMTNIIREIKKSEIPEEMVQVLSAIESCEAITLS